MWACTHKQADQPPPRGHAASCCCRPVPTACVPACYSTCACVCAGELTLRGLVLPVGGIKEKLVAAQAAGMARVLVPARNMPDVLVGGGGVGALLLLLRRCYRSGRGAAQLPNPGRLPLISPCTPPPPPPCNCCRRCRRPRCPPTSGPHCRWCPASAWRRCCWPPLTRPSLCRRRRACSPPSGPLLCSSTYCRASIALPFCIISCSRCSTTPLNPTLSKIRIPPPLGHTSYMLPAPAHHKCSRLL